MPASKEHIDQAKHNRSFLEELSRNDSVRNTFHDWIATVIFYIALHYTDNFIDSFLNLHPSGHREREEILATNKRFTLSFWKCYKRLYDASITARYEPDKWKGTIDQDRIKLFLKDLNVIKDPGRWA